MPLVGIQVLAGRVEVVFVEGTGDVVVVAKAEDQCFCCNRVTVTDNPLFARSGTAFGPAGDGEGSVRQVEAGARVDILMRRSEQLQRPEIGELRRDPRT